MTAAGAEAGELRGWATELRKLAAHVEDSGGRGICRRGVKR
jgi:hypothetical protein